jgi:hypothetical protein
MRSDVVAAGYNATGHETSESLRYPFQLGRGAIVTPNTGIGDAITTYEVAPWLAMLCDDFRQADTVKVKDAP